MSTCPCGTTKSYQECCEPFVIGKQLPTTAEELMRSRYTAYANGSIDYIKDTIHPRKIKHHNEEETKDWSHNSAWHGLEIVSTEDGGADDSEGVVEFVARYTPKKAEQQVEHREVATFQRVDKRWYFTDGKTVGPPPITREAPKVGRNDPCPCGSGKKHKKCCG